MLAAHLVESGDGALEQAPDAFDPVGMHISDDPFLDGSVIDGFVAGVVVGDTKIGLEFVGLDGLSFVFDDSAESRARSLAVHPGLLNSNLPAALDGASQIGLWASRVPCLGNGNHTSVIDFDDTSTNVGPLRGSFPIASRMRG